MPAPSMRSDAMPFAASQRAMMTATRELPERGLAPVLAISTGGALSRGCAGVDRIPNSLPFGPKRIGVSVP